MKMSKLLLLYLEAPMQSWGLRARWDVRDSGSEPSKSGVVGLLGCALGYPVGDRRLVELDEGLRMGVRVDHSGVRLPDFHTVSGVMPQADGGFKGSEDNPNTIISYRTYLHDAAFLVVLSGAEDILITCARALKDPRWPIFLGRKSCVPTSPVFRELTSKYESIEDVLRNYPWLPRGGKDRPDQLRCIIEDEHGESVRPDKQIGSPIGMYGQRKVRVEWVPTPVVDELAI